MSIRINNIHKIVTWNPDTENFDELSNVEILISNGVITEIGTAVSNGDTNIDAQNCLITPGFIDSHTHPVFIGNRANEFSMRAAGKSYKEIAAAGGGILSSIQGVRYASEDELFQSSLKNIQTFITHGTTTLEAKSGYGLTIEDEIKSLRVIKRLNKESPIEIISTFLGAHAFPPEFTDDHQRYVDLICNEMIPDISDENLAEFCDVFCEEGYFTVEQSRQILKTAKNHGLAPRLHADEFVDSGAAELAGEVSAVSADHLMAVSDAGIRSLADNNVIATLLPGTTLFLGKYSYANGRTLIDAGVEVALATDFNPGSSTLNSLPWVMSLTVLYCGLTPEEALKGVTWNAAKSLNRENSMGRIAANYQADLIFWDVNELEEISYWLGSDKIIKVLKKGKEVPRI